MKLQKGATCLFLKYIFTFGLVRGASGRAGTQPTSGMELARKKKPTPKPSGFSSLLQHIEIQGERTEKREGVKPNNGDGPCM